MNNRCADRRGTVQLEPLWSEDNEKFWKESKMEEERTRQLLEMLLDVLADRFDLDAVICFMKAAGFTDKEIMELKYADLMAE